MATTDTDMLLPEVRQEICYRRNGQKEWHTGIVALIWAYEEAIINIEGGGSLIPAFGDEWKPTPAGEPANR